MPNRKFSIETNSDKYRILITHPSSKLSQEIIRQLKPYSQVEILTSIENEKNNKSIDIVLHDIGNEVLPSQINTFTTYLQNLLNLAKSFKSKFFLLIPQKNNTTIRSAVNQVVQFSHKYNLKSQVFETIDNETLLEAEAIISKFIKRHHAPVLPIPPKLNIKKTPPKAIPVRIQPKTIPPPNLINIKKPIFYFVLTIAILLFPWSLTLLQFALIPQFINCSYGSLTQGELGRSRNCSQTAAFLTYGFNTTSRVSLMSELLFKSIGLPLQPLISTFSHITNTMNLSIELTENYTQMFNHFVSHADPDYQIDVPFLTYHLSSLSEQLAYLQSDMRDLYLSSKKPLSYIENIAFKVSQTQQIINKIQKITVDLPNLLSQHRKNTYLILLQDNLEIRPAGGFIDSFILISAEDGVITDTQIYSSSFADSRLKGQVVPPSDLKFALGETSWYLRDSNWEPDFTVAAQKIAWFVEKELSRPVDVVIAVNWTTIQEILKQTGPQILIQNGQKIDQNNVLKTYLDQVKPAGSENNPSFIYELSQSLVNKITDLDQKNTTDLLLGLLGLADNRQLLIYPLTFKSESLKVAGWSGNIVGQECSSQNLCYQDYFYLVHSNVGINKSDYYVTPKTLVSVNLKPNIISYNLNLQLKNDGPQTTWPTGKYRDYLRIYLTQNTDIDSVKLNGQELNRTNYSVTFNNGLPILSVLLEVSTSQAIELDIIAHKNINLKEVFHYQLHVPNQPGLLKNPLQLDITYPIDWLATVYKKPAVASEGRLQYNASGEESVLIDVDFSANK